MGAILTSPDWAVIQKELNRDFYPDFRNIKKKNTELKIDNLFFNWLYF